jgi:hypothetical protein
MRTDTGFEGVKLICLRRIGIIVSMCDLMISGDSIMRMYSVLIAFARRTGEGRVRDCNRSGNNEGSSGNRISFGTFAMILARAIR